ncbi:MAG: 7TM diverse intracellular signaling domain-containing protein, partial [Bacteroidota bacterium]
MASFAKQVPVELPAGGDFSISIDTSHVVLYKDAQNRTLKQILALSDQFDFHSSQVIKDRDDHLWVRLKVLKQSADFQRVYLYTSKNDFVDAYLLSNGKVVDTYKGGHMMPMSERHVRVVKSYGYFELRDAGEYEIYARLTAGYHYHLTTFALQGENEFLDSLMINDLIVYSLLGIFLVMIIYSVLVFFNFKDKAYLYYALYLLSVSLFYMLADGVLKEYIFPERPEVTYIFMSTVVIAPLFYYLFLQEFLEISELLPSWDKFFYWQRYFHLFVFVLL